MASINNTLDATTSNIEKIEKAFSSIKLPRELHVKHKENVEAGRWLSSL